MIVMCNDNLHLEIPTNFLDDSGYLRSLNEKKNKIIPFPHGLLMVIISYYNGAELNIDSAHELAQLLNATIILEAIKCNRQILQLLIKSLNKIDNREHDVAKDLDHSLLFRNGVVLKWPFDLIRRTVFYDAMNDVNNDGTTFCVQDGDARIYNYIFNYHVMSQHFSKDEMQSLMLFQIDYSMLCQVISTLNYLNVEDYLKTFTEIMAQNLLTTDSGDLISHLNIVKDFGDNEMEFIAKNLSWIS
jgi:hypothetical protein